MEVRLAVKVFILVPVGKIMICLFIYIPSKTL